MNWWLGPGLDREASLAVWTPALRHFNALEGAARRFQPASRNQNRAIALTLASPHARGPPWPAPCVPGRLRQLHPQPDGGDTCGSRLACSRCRTLASFVSILLQPNREPPTAGTGESHLDALLRVKLLYHAVTNGHVATIREAKRRFWGNVSTEEVGALALRCPCHYPVPFLQGGDPGRGPARRGALRWHRGV